MKAGLPKNINKKGRILRLLAGIVLLGLGFWKMQWIYIVAGLFCCFEAYMSWCIVYHIMGIKDCGCKKK